MRGVLRLYYKSRFSSHGNSGRPRHTIRLYYKSRLSSYGSSACPRRTIRLYYKKSTFPATEAPGVPGVLYVCTTKVDFPATEAPRVRGVLRLYYKSRLSSHGSSGRPLRTTFVLQNSIFQPRKSPAYYVCTTQVEKQTQKTQKNTTVLAPRPRENPHTAPTPKPAEGLRLYVKKRKNTTVLAPRQRRNPQRVVCGHEKKYQKRRF